jgi:internalin A
MLKVKVSLLSLVLFSAFACDEEKKPELSPKPTAAAPVVPATASVTAETPKPVVKKDPVVCPPPGGALKTDDPVLEGQIRIKLSKKPGDSIKMSEVANVKSINLTESKKLAELDSCTLPRMTGLHYLYLGPGEYEDLSPLSGLTHLETLRISISKVKDLRPIAKMTMMDQLDLGRTLVSDLTPIAGLVNITELSLDGTQIRDIAVLSGMKKLMKLSIRNTQVTDLSPLREIKTLKTLDLTGTSISDLSAVSGLVGRGLTITR